MYNKKVEENENQRDRQIRIYHSSYENNTSYENIKKDVGCFGKSKNYWLGCLYVHM